MQWIITYACAAAVLLAHPIAVAEDDPPPGPAFFKENAELCETIWPSQTSPDERTSLRCARYWALRHGLGYDGTSPKRYASPYFYEEPITNGAFATRYLAAEFEAMAAHARAAASIAPGERPELTGPAGPAIARAIELFDGAARSHFTLVDSPSGWNDRIDSILEKVLAGERLRPIPVSALSAVGLWKLRNAVYARHGYAFRNPDLARFFYGDRGLGEATPLLPLKVNPDFAPSMLTKVDWANVVLIRKAERSAL